ncbi:MAG: hypothetical protein J2P13_02490 [Acidobacteria bacterium]|nr:hypothetical protein [Acidobacteriota bacterium]
MPNAVTLPSATHFLVVPTIDEVFSWRVVNTAVGEEPAIPPAIEIAGVLAEIP